MFYKFFPSEIARLVLGYLKELKCSQSWQTFLSECPDLQEYFRIYQDGEEYSTVVDGKSLIETLQEYRRLKDVFKFFPSEIARLVLGYLKELKCSQSWQTFLSECPDLQEYFRIYQDGEEYPTVVDGKSLKVTLQEYRRLKDEAQKNTENQNHFKQDSSSTSNPEVFKSPWKTVENPRVPDKVNQRAHSQPTITSIHHAQSKEKSPRPSDTVTSTPSRGTTKQPRRLEGVHVTHLNFDAANDSGNEADESSRRLCVTNMRTPSRNISTSWTFRSTTPSRRTCQTDPVRRKVNFFSRTPQRDLAKSKNPRDPQTQQSNNNLQKEFVSHLPEQENINLNAEQTEERLKNQRLVLGSSEASTSDMQSSIVNQSIILRTSEVTRSEDNITITTTKSSFTPQNDGEPPIYHRAPDTNSPRLVLSYDRSLISSLSTPMKDRRSWTEDFSSPKRKGFIPRRRLMNESPNPKQMTSNDMSLGSLPELNLSLLEEFLNNQPLVQKIADNINKVINNDELMAPEDSISTGFPSLQDIQGSENIIKSVLARTEADPMFDQCLSFLYSSREWEEVTATQDSPYLGNPDIDASNSILVETPDQGVLNTPTQPTATSSKTEVTKDVQTEDIPTLNPSHNIEQEKITAAAITSQDNSSIINENNVNNIASNEDTTAASVSVTESPNAASTSNAEPQDQVYDNKQQDLNTPSRTIDVLDSCMSLIQPDSEGIVHDDTETASVALPEPEFVMDIEDKTIKQVPIGTPCQFETQMAPDQTACDITLLNQTTSSSVIQSQTVPLVSTLVQSSQNGNVTILPAVQNVGNMYSTLNPSSTISQLPYSSVPTFFIPTMTSNPLNIPCGIIVNSGNNWYCSNIPNNVMPYQNTSTVTKNVLIQSNCSHMPNNVVMPYQNVPTITHNVPIQSMPVVNQSPIRIPHDYSPTKAFCGNSIIQMDNVDNVITIPAPVTEKQPKNIINKKKSKSLLKVAPSRIKKAKNTKSQKRKKKRRTLFPTPSKETLENIVNEEVGNFPVLSIPEPSPGKSCSLSAMELFNNITGNKSPQSPLLKEVLSRAKILAGKSLANSSHVRTLEFTSPNPKRNNSKNSKVPRSNVCERRRCSPRLKQKTKSPNCSSARKEASKDLCKEKKAGDDKNQSNEKDSSPSKKSPKKSVSMTEEVLGAMAQAMQSKSSNSTKDCASKDEVSVIKSRNISSSKDLGKKPGNKSPIKKTPVKSPKSVSFIDRYFPSNLTDSESDPDLPPLSKLTTDKTTIPTKASIKKASIPVTSSSKEDSVKELDDSIEIIENSDTSLGNNFNSSNNRKKYPRKAKKLGCPCHETNSTSKALQSSKNPSTLEAFVNKSPRKVNRNVDSNSRNRLSKSSSGEEQCEKKQVFSTKEIPSTSQKDCNLSKDIQLNKSDNSEIQIHLKNKTQAQKESNVKDKEIAEDALEDLFLPEKTIKITRKCNSNKDIGNEKKLMVNSLSNNNLHPENSDTQKLNDLDVDSCEKASSSDERICLDDTLPNAIETIHSFESGQSSASLKSTKPINKLNENSPQSAKCRIDSPKSLTKESPKVPLISAITSKPVIVLNMPCHNSPKHADSLQSTNDSSKNIAKDAQKVPTTNTIISKPVPLLDSPKYVNKNSPQSTKHRNDSPKNITKEPEKIPLTSAITNKPVQPHNSPKSVNKNSPPSSKHENYSFTNIVKDSYKDSVTLLSNEEHNKSPKLPSSGKMANIIPKDISNASPKNNLKKLKTVKQCTSPLTNHVTPSEAASNESLKHSRDKPQSLYSTVKEKETNSNNRSSLPEIKITSSSDSDKLPPLPLKKILPPPKKRIRPIPVTSPNNGGFSPFSPFSSPAHLSAVDIVSNSKIKTPILVNDGTSVPMSKRTDPRIKLPAGGKPKAMTEFYKAALPDRSNDLPISPGTVSSSSCTLDTFLARKMLTGSCAKNGNSQIGSTAVASDPLEAKGTPTKKLSADNLKYLFSEEANSFSPLKIAHNVLYPSSASSPFAVFNHGENTLTADENLAKSPLKRDAKSVILTPVSTQQSSSEKDDDSSDEEGEIFSPVKTMISKADPVRISHFVFPAHLSPHKKVLPTKNKRKSSPMKVVVVNDCITPSSSTVSNKFNQDNNIPPAVKEGEKTAVNAYNLLLASSKLPIRSCPPKDPVSHEEGLITSPVNAVACNEDMLTSRSMSNKKRRRSSSPEIGEPHKKWSRLECSKRRRLSSSPEIEESCVKQSLSNHGLSNKLSRDSPVRSLVAFKDTKPKTWKQKRVEQNPRIPAGVKIPSKWDYSNISTYKTAIENQSKEDSRKEQLSNKKRIQQKSSQRQVFQSPKKAFSKRHRSFPSKSESYEKSKVSYSTGKLDQSHPHKSRRLEDYQFSYKNSPRKYGRPNSTEYFRLKKSDDFTHKENEKISRDTSSTSKTSWNSVDKSVEHKTEKDSGKSSKSETSIDIPVQKDEDLSTKTASEKPDHVSDYDERNNRNSQGSISLKDISGSPKVKRKSVNQSISKDVLLEIASEKSDHASDYDEKNIVNPHKAISPKNKLDSPKVKKISANKSTSHEVPLEIASEKSDHASDDDERNNVNPHKAILPKVKLDGLKVRRKSANKSTSHEVPFEIASEKSDHASDNDERNNLNPHKAISPKDKLDGLKVRRKSANKSTSHEVPLEIASEKSDHASDDDERNNVNPHKAILPKVKLDGLKVRRKSANKSTSNEVPFEFACEKPDHAADNIGRNNLNLHKSISPKDKLDSPNVKRKSANKSISHEGPLEIASEKPDHASNYDGKNNVNPHEAIQPDKSDSPKGKRKRTNTSLPNDDLVTPSNSELAQNPIPLYEKTKNIYCESNASPRILDELNPSIPISSDSVIEPEYNFRDGVEENKDTESRTSADQNELNEAVAFLTNDNEPEESQQECQIGTSSAQAPLIDATSDVQPAGSNYVQEPDNRISPGKVANSEAGESKPKTTGPAKMDMDYILQRVKAAGGFEKLLEVMRIKQ